jgi:hypothetical protein
MTSGRRSSNSPHFGTSFPAERARIAQLPVERVDVRLHGVEVRLPAEGTRRAGAGSGEQQEGSGVTRATVSADGETITVQIPLTFRKCGGRKRVVTPDVAEWALRWRAENVMVRALARVFHRGEWRSSGCRQFEPQTKRCVNSTIAQPRLSSTVLKCATNEM